MYVQDTIVAQATAAGQAAVAIVRLSGPDAIRILRSIWHPIRARIELLPRRLCLGEIRDPASGAALDHAMAVVMPAPRSLTGEDVAEIQCHGGAYLVRRVIGAAMTLGARLAEPGEFSRRAFLNGRMDLTAAEAVADLVEARGDGALRQALEQMVGALADRVARMRHQLIGVRAHLEAEIDFGDEGIKLPSRDEIVASIGRLIDEMRPLHDSFARGRLMRSGAHAAIVGKPNVGKSSIMNLLLGVERAIVTAIPGTTRDVIEDSVALGPYHLVIQDTAGLRDGGDEVERIGIERALSHAAGADLLIAVFDGASALEADDSRVIEIARGCPGIAILNKRDLAPRLTPAMLRERGVAMPILPLCALNADGLGALRDELIHALDALVGSNHGETVAVSRERHRAALARALEALEAARGSALAGMPPEIVAVDVAIASDALGSITGEVTSEDVLDSIFREFCIGK